MTFLHFLFDLAAIVILLRVLLRDEIRAALERDPAARSGWEVLLLYPSVQAIAVYRAAHFLHRWRLRFLEIGRAHV